MTRSEAAENIHSMRKFRREVTASPEAARQALKEAGIMTDDGEIADPYRALFEREPSECIEEVQV
ncbi:hypothetical protein [Thiorhodococcus minor]|uniref:Uncharacterized protein n=1 Tax=Thiorhodococcus minor TaxID=57489 RepID=A0A6M0JVR2_9GAMM|nr:hypothetical protein [Thiorhodococcus minor]NEV61598.1 hypothetical protein [Thiorhodococcus minor]